MKKRLRITKHSVQVLVLDQPQLDRVNGGNVFPPKITISCPQPSYACSGNCG